MLGPARWLHLIAYMFLRSRAQGGPCFHTVILAPIPSITGCVPPLLPISHSSAGCRVNVYKDKVKNAGNLPALPQQAALHDALAGTYAELR